jgi:acetylornithine deacetylase/succinyl-diaminopimelate desuccinylase-like protein
MPRSLRRPTLALLLAATAAVPLGAQASPYAVSAPAPAGFDRAAAQAATLLHVSNLIRRNTQNPPGNEIVAAQYLDSVFRQIPGVETRILEAAPGRANFYARLRAARPTKRPVVVMGHMDVVTADTAKWDTDPFEPVVRDGYLYGRGAIDDKGMLAATTVALAQLARQRDRLTRDIILIGTAGEEGGPTVGIAWILQHHPDLVKDAEFALNEGGRIRVADGRVRTVNVQTTEKVYQNVVARATGPSGHGSVPLPDNALAALARAVARVHEWQAPVKLNETTRLYFERLAEVEEDALMKGAMLAVSRPGADSAAIAAAAAVLSRDPLHNAILRTGASLTQLGGGQSQNVIPSEGTANFNVRVLPNDDVRAIVAAMNAAGGEPQVTFTLEGEPETSPPPSPVGSALFQAMEKAALAMSPGTVVIPFMSTGATDGAVLRAAGIPAYGILPMPLPMEDELRMHGDNERVPVPALGWATEYIYRVLAEVVR